MDAGGLVIGEAFEMKQETVKPHHLYLALFILVWLCFQQANEVEAGQSRLNFSQPRLEAPESHWEKEYLGLKDQQHFFLSEISAKLILIEFLSLYCPSCSQQAAAANELHKLIEDDPDLNGDIKVIGICAGNNPRETELYRDQFLITFPLFPDPDFVIHDMFGSPRTPFTMVVSNEGSVLFIRSGLLENVKDFVRLVKKLHKEL